MKKEIKNEEIKNEKIKNEEIKNEEIKNEEIKNEEIKNEKIKNEKIKNEEIKNEEIKNEEKNIFKDCKNGLERFIKISNFDINKPNEFKILSKHSYEIKNANLFFENGGSWCRKESINKNKYKIATIKKNGKINYLWDVEEEEKHRIKEAFNKFYLHL